MKFDLYSFRIYVTERCNANCANCFNASARKNSEMTTDVFKQLCVYLKENGIKVLKIMGGEPSIHKDFFEIVQIAQENFERIIVFTNGTLNKIKNLQLRESDHVVYNFKFFNVLNEETLALNKKGTRGLEVQVSSKTDEIKLAENVLKIINLNDQKISFALTLDCTENIFEHRFLLISKLKYLEDFFSGKGISIRYDHRIPFCFLYKSSLRFYDMKKCRCDIRDSGLIDADLNLRMCNQHSKKILPLRIDDKFVPFEIIKNYLQQEYFSWQTVALNKICHNCVFYDKNCNGGCWITNANISKDSILGNIEFPKK